MSAKQLIKVLEAESMELSKESAFEKWISRNISKRYMWNWCSDDYTAIFGQFKNSCTMGNCVEKLSEKLQKIKFQFFREQHMYAICMCTSNESVKSTLVEKCAPLLPQNCNVEVILQAFNNNAVKMGIRDLPYGQKNEDLSEDEDASDDDEGESNGPPQQMYGRGQSSGPPPNMVGGMDPQAMMQGMMGGMSGMMQQGGGMLNPGNMMRGGGNMDPQAMMQGMMQQGGGMMQQGGGMMQQGGGMPQMGNMMGGMQGMMGGMMGMAGGMNPQSMMQQGGGMPGMGGGMPGMGGGMPGMGGGMPDMSNMMNNMTQQENSRSTSHMTQHSFGNHGDQDDSNPRAGFGFF